MFKVFYTTPYSHLSNKTVAFFSKKEDAEDLIASLKKMEIKAFYRIEMSNDVFGYLLRKDFDLISKKSGENIVVNVDSKTKDEIISKINEKGRRSFSRYFCSVEPSIKKTISKNKFGPLKDDIKENIAKAILYFDKKIVKDYSLSIKEVPLY